MEIDGCGRYRRRFRRRRFMRSRRSRYYRGRGMYTGHGGFGREIGSAIGGALGSRLGNASIGRKIGGWTGNKITKWLGHGDYTTETNSLITDQSGGVAPEVPSFSSAGDETGALTITHKEYMTDIYGPTTSFNVQAYSLNPGLDSTFPFLSQIACNYEEYELLQCIFTYRSTTTDIGTSTTGQCGTVVMCTNYNAANPPFNDKQTMMEYDGAMSCKTTEHMMHGVECDPNKLSGSTGKYVRAGPINQTVNGASDLNSYDHGNFQIAICNSPTGFQNQVIGELWIS